MVYSVFDRFFVEVSKLPMFHVPQRAQTILSNKLIFIMFQFFHEFRPFNMKEKKKEFGEFKLKSGRFGMMDQMKRKKPNQMCKRFSEMGSA